MYGEIKQQLAHFKSQGISIRKRNPITATLYQSILHLTQFLDPSAKIKERVYCIENNITSVPICKHCNLNTTYFLGPHAGYRDYCSVKCSSNSVGKKQQIKETNIKKYGVEHPAQNKDIQTKIIATSLEKYGVAHPHMSEVVQHKKRKTFNEKYGADSYFESDICKKTLPIILQERYGVNNVAQIPGNAEKRLQTLKDRYGPSVTSGHFINTPASSIDLLNDKDWLCNQNNVLNKPMYVIAQEIGVSPSVVRCRFHDFKIPIKTFSASVAEQEIANFLKEKNIDVIEGDRTLISPYQLDIFLPAFNIAIEYNGIYWHSELAGKTKQYHLDKLNRCKDKDIRLIQIWETDWLLKREIVQSRLLNLIGLNTSIYARKCKINDIPNNVSSNFYDITHLQGDCPTKINIGLIYENELVALMSFGKARFSKKVQYELLRYSTKLHTNVVGGASKLFKHFIKTYNPTSIVSYCDKRWNTGNLYKQLGFQFSHNSTPNYYYFNSDVTKLYHRVQFQKHKLKDKLDIFDPKMSEWGNMVNNGYNRIWDCGNQVWTWHG